MRSHLSHMVVHSWRTLAVALVATGCAAGARATRPPDASATPVAADSVAESLLVDVSALHPAPVVDLRYATADNFTGSPLPGYGADRALLRREAASALARASAALAARGLRIKIWDAYRPVRATRAMVEWTRRSGRTDLLRDGYIAEYSRHNLGLAVDCTLVDAATGRELEMGTPFDTFSAAAHTDSATGTVLANRLVLRDAMSSAGFVPYDAEWWHFAVMVPNAPRLDVPIR